MSKTLIIAEKPSVAQDIVRALTPVAGKFEKHDEYFEGEHHLVTSAVGHLLEIKAPEEYDVKRGKWSFANLPVIPPHFELNPIDKSKGRLNAIVKLVKRKDVSELVNACDAGREGELIFRLIQQHSKSKHPVKRLWLQSMTPAAIREGFENLRTDQQMLPLADAARCRSEADWLVGINGTRAMTAFNSRDGGFFLTTVGRVQTPTLSIVVEREEKIRRHVSRDYWEIKATFAAQAGEYDGKWFDPKWKKNPDDPELRADRVWNEADAKAIADASRGQPASVTEESKPSTQSAPQLYDLTSLQREANSRFGFSAKTTLSLAQALYEKHKVLTYPRTDSKALPEDYVPVVKQTMEMLATEDLPGPLQALAAHARKAVKEGYVKPNKRIFDNAKVSDHFAIIPTLQAPKSLTEIEAKLYDMVVKRFLAVFYPSAEFLVTTRISTVEAAGKSHSFQTNGKVMVKPGWLAVYGREVQEDDANLVAVEPGEKVRAESVDLNAQKTKPPARYSEATLLSAMEGAGKLIDDDELREAMQEKGLGTPATRAAIIEGLILEKYIIRDGRELIPTAKAFQLTTLLRGLGVEDLTKPELTGNWEHQLSEMEKGRLSRERFMAEIAAMTERIVAKAKEYDRDTIPGDYATLKTPCPNCGGVVKENYRRFTCTGADGASEGCGFSIGKIPGGRSFELDEVEQFLANKRIGPLEGFRSKAGWPFTAELKLTFDDEIKNWKLEFDFGEDAKKDGESGEPVDFSDQQSLGPCPKCQGHVYEHGANYVCEHSVGAKVTCDFKTGKIILQQPVIREQMTKLLETGKTDLLENFVSNKTRRKFKAFLAFDKKEGKVSFEFQPRAAKPPAAKKTAAKTAAKKAA
ncbi:DNA topoisomerase III [Piscinibacter gummiphilus]|uniref:DNA topoisomerase n=1 Tax=Piscinibacter gummiphilus TaxID=946333 RepID=A0A1W6LFW7_9BURK|nr:DNA topoisomerase III [Piscinibacter gummiphilus]ARN23155.1 DNA topoisomerase III [Piscinibacter gummiphilus]ATU67853.1 DNA topoisomerase III [Piscinibacter gummiphilus]GLS97134.1 DNA topoisomerase III [Piscinibacter gummiphilus]